MAENRVRVKICGITREEDLRACIDAGADFVGFVVDVPSSPRNLTIERAMELINMAPLNIMKVVVTVFVSVDRLIEIYERLRPDYMQVYALPTGDKEVRRVAAWMPIIKAVNVGQEFRPEEVLKDIDLFRAIHVDSGAQGRYGGTGVTHDWSISRKIRDLVYPKPLILAGGLKPENVYNAILAVKPFAVDVSSGVESMPGVKDRQKMVSFIREVRRAEKALSIITS